MAAEFEFPLRVRYMEVDAQGVVFNAWYLTYLDEAFTAFLGARGISVASLAAADWDMQLVHTEIDWTAGLRWQDDAVVSVSTARLGQTSFTLDFEVRRNEGTVCCSARTVYVVIGKDGSGKRPLPPELAAALGPAAPPREARA